MKKIFILYLIIMSFVITSCGYREGIIQKAEKSFIQFTGNTENVSVQIDNTTPFILKKYTSNNEDTRKKVDYKNKLFQVSPGKHIIKVYRDQQLVVKRILILDNQTIKEVKVP